MWSNAQIPAYQFLNLQAISLIIYKQLQQMKQSKLKILKSLWKKRYLVGGGAHLHHDFQIFEKKHKLMEIVLSFRNWL